ncbi:MAG: AMP-binding protein [Betaproteobacteria bacterium]|nr:AMP-binding protein [Betaproteobacteria bacterium]MDH3437996.1 AMP-binding protein [Betaproteobacteria bacterium]
MLKVVFKWLLRGLLRITVEGDVQALRAARPLIIANQGSALDGALLALFLPVPVTVAVSPDDLRRPVVRWLIGRLRHITVEPARPLELKRLVRMVQRGEAVVVLPEGRPTTTGTLMKVYDAPGVIAARCDADLVPIVIEGSIYSRFAGTGGNFPKRWLPRITLRILPATKLPEIPELRGRARRRRLADEMLRIMQRAQLVARPRRTLFEAFLEAVELHGRHTCIIEDARKIPETYGELLKVSLALGRLATRLAKEEEVLGVMMPNISTTVSLLLGMTAMRRIPAIINYTAGGEAMRAACTAAGVKRIITSRRFLQMARLERAAKALEGFEFLYVEDLRGQLTVADKLWLIGFALWWPRAAVPASDPGDSATVLFTSGSEGRSKGVVLSHEAMLANMAQMRAVIDFGPNDKYLNALPLYHIYGLIACTLMPLMSGTRLFLYTSPLHYRVIPEIAYTRDCTYIFGTSTFLGHYGRQAHPYDFYRARVVVSGGEKLDADVAQLWMEKFGLRIMEGYGATECGPAMALNTPLSYRKGTVGRFLPGLEYRLLPVPGIDRGGALHVRSPNLMRGYYLYEEPGVLQPMKSDLGPGWYTTGDVVEVDEDGYVTILGRVKRFAKIAGEMISLEVVERIAALAAPGQRHAATIEHVAAGGESTVLFTTDPALDRITLLKAARELGAPELAVAKRIVHMAELPVLGSGKTDYVGLKAMAESHRQAGTP